MDKFEDISHFAPGSHVIVSTSETSHVAGVVESVDADARALHFTDGRTLTFPPDTEPVAESEPGEETDNG